MPSHAWTKTRRLETEGLLDSMLDSSFVFAQVPTSSKIKSCIEMHADYHNPGFLLSHFQHFWRTGQISELDMIKVMKDIDLRAFYAIGVAFLGEGIGSMCCSATFAGFLGGELLHYL